MLPTLIMYLDAIREIIFGKEVKSNHLDDVSLSKEKNVNWSYESSDIGVGGVGPPLNKKMIYSYVYEFVGQINTPHQFNENKNKVGRVWMKALLRSILSLH